MMGFSEWAALLSVLISGVALGISLTVIYRGRTR